MTSAPSAEKAYMGRGKQTRTERKKKIKERVLFREQKEVNAAAHGAKS